MFSDISQNLYNVYNSKNKNKHEKNNILQQRKRENLRREVKNRRKEKKRKTAN